MDQFRCRAAPGHVKHVENLLRKLQDIRAVEVFTMYAAPARTVGRFKIMCDRVTWIEVLQIVAATDVRVLTVQSTWIFIETIGTKDDIERLEEFSVPAV